MKRRSWKKDFGIGLVVGLVCGGFGSYFYFSDDLSQVFHSAQNTTPRLKPGESITTVSTTHRLGLNPKKSWPFELHKDVHVTTVRLAPLETTPAGP